MSSQRTVIITGAAGTLGVALADAFAGEYRVVLVDRPGDVLGEIAGRLPGASAIPADLTEEGACRRVVKAALDRTGSIDVLVNNAAICPRRPFLEMDEETLEQVWQVNFKAAYLLTQYTVPHMGEGGAIVNITSPAARLGGLLNVSAYAATKAALENLSKSLARELGPRGIRINSLSPGTMESPLLANITDELREGLISDIPLGRFADPAEVARAAVFLAGPKASFTTGSTLYVDGGFTMA